MPFQFKQFTISQEKAAMKVGTDGVLLGTWTPVDHRPQTILDIGAGTGLIALMLAQRTTADQIDALEIDADAYEECVANFENSPWNGRLFCYHASLDDFMDELEDETYDLIVSNPPFYSSGFGSGDEKRDTARQNAALPFTDLCEAASLLLSEDGVFCVVIPYVEEQAFVATAVENDLYPFRITRVKGTPTTEIKRSLLAFRSTRPNVLIDELIIETARHEYTADYIALTQDFFLKM
ncbi:MULTISPECIES: tRNA1(Val) (adenine(37)-N6)-methyltransferase [unclassified Flavobacterium]|uniref:tRNA1(Val) (adenine(37)-N6)-methyltransferase n=1 Tax=unclassified Flavobacterium TaxID=196869 RepID=UPI001F12F4C4|nr:MULTISPECIES: methyltransferase [unclassified Flavobacterium]UMY66699.1 methyltransferase [Flavobacterium sp. HJ-32-4]